MKQSLVKVAERNSVKLSFANAIISLRRTSGDTCEVAVGCPGLPNVVRKMLTGDAILFETPEHGIIEFRVMSQTTIAAEFLVTQVSPKPGIAGAFITDDPNNTSFSPDEMRQIEDSISHLKESLNRMDDTFSPEQLHLVSDKLDEIKSASQRLGRKDWINYAAGALTSMCVSAAFAPAQTRSLFEAANRAFQWLFVNALMLLP